MIFLLVMSFVLTLGSAGLAWYLLINGKTEGWVTFWTMLGVASLIMWLIVSGLAVASLSTAELLNRECDMDVTPREAFANRSALLSYYRFSKNCGD